MDYYRELKRQYLLKEITIEEYKKKEDEYIRRLTRLYFRDFITLEELKDRIK